MEPKKSKIAVRQVGRSFVYVPVLRREVLRGLAVQDLVDRFFDGSQEALAEHLRNGAAEAPALVKKHVEASLDTTLL